MIYKALGNDRGTILWYLFGVDPALPKNGEPGPGHRITKGQASAVVGPILDEWFTPEFIEYILGLAAIPVIKKLGGYNDSP